jgi:hypothetical protein
LAGIHQQALSRYLRAPALLSKKREVLSVMVEVRRNLYMDESTGRKTESFETLRSGLLRIESILSTAEIAG